jgi:hypothetical protein
MVAKCVVFYVFFDNMYKVHSGVVEMRQHFKGGGRRAEPGSRDFSVEKYS